jgi:hypothetical protein
MNLNELQIKIKVSGQIVVTNPPKEENKKSIYS